MAIDMTAIVTDLGLLTADELEKLQLAVNREVAVRIQDERAKRRLKAAIEDAQSMGYTDDTIDTIFTEAKNEARKPPVDPAAKVPKLKEPEKIGKPFSTPPVDLPPVVPNNRPTK